MLQTSSKPIVQATAGRGRFGRRACLLATAVIGLPSVLLCARYDLELSRKVVHAQARWALFADRYGELPGWVAVALALLVALVRSARLGTVLQRHPHVGEASRLMLWLGAWSLLFVHPTKLLWGRVRFRDLDATFHAFSPWYLPQGITGHSSFPSGHVAMAWMLLPCVVLFPRASALRALTTLSVIAWGCFVAAGRVVIGAHYASDVLFSTLFALVVLLACPRGGHRF